MCLSLMICDSEPLSRLFNLIDDIKLTLKSSDVGKADLFLASCSL